MYYCTLLPFFFSQWFASLLQLQVLISKATVAVAVAVAVPVGNLPDQLPAEKQSFGRSGMVLFRPGGLTSFSKYELYAYIPTLS